MLQVERATYSVILDFMVNSIYAQKYSDVFLWNAWNVLTRMRRRKKCDTFCTYKDRDDKIATSAKLLDITYSVLI